MKCTIETEQLQAGLMTVIKSLSSKPVLPVLEGIYLETTTEGLLLRCSDMSLQIECLLPAVIEEEGTTVLPGRLFTEFVRKVKSESIELLFSDRTMHIRAGRAKTKLQSLDHNEFPNMETNGDIITLPIPQQVCKDMIRQTVFAVAAEDTKPILTGILCEVRENCLSMVALDGFRLALRKHLLDSAYEEKEFVVPGKSMMDIARTLQDTNDNMFLQFSKTHLLIDLGHTRLVSRLLDGNFIKYKGLLPSEHISRIRVNRDALFESIERASLLSREGGNNIVRFQVLEGLLRIIANSPKGHFEEELEIHLNGEEVEIAFNARYLSDLLKALPDEEVFMDMNNSVSPCVVRPVQGDAFYYLLLPMRIFK
jgi:DNA polymerase-3 subunit beta